MPAEQTGTTRISRRLTGVGFFVFAVWAWVAPAIVATAAQAGEAPPAAVPQERLDFCLRCHGSAGLATNPATPDLANQRLAYLQKQMADFNAAARENLQSGRNASNFTGRRDHPDMHSFAGTVPEAETPALLQALSAGRACRQPPPPPGVSTNRPPAKPALVERCIACHGNKGAHTVNPIVPRLAGQSRTYIAAQMFAMRRAAYRGDESSKPSGLEATSAITLRSHPIMNAVAVGLSTDEIRAIADYLSTLPCS